MKISNKQKAKFITTPDKHFFIVPPQNSYRGQHNSTEIILLDEKEDLKYHVGNIKKEEYPQYLDTETLISGDEFEDTETFEEKCKQFCNPHFNVNSIFVDGNNYMYCFFNSRSAFLKELNKHEKAYVFVGNSYAYIPEADNHSAKIMPIEDDTVVCLYMNPNKVFKYILSVFTPDLFCNLLFGDTPVSSKLQDAVRAGHIFKSGYDVPTTDLLTLPPWKIGEKYPGLTVMPTTTKKHDVVVGLSDYFDCSGSYWLRHNLNNCRKVIATTRTALNWFAACSATADKASAAVKKFAPRDKFAIIETPGQALIYETPIEITDQCSACNALERVALFPITGHSVLANGTDRNFSDYANYGTKWYTLFYDEKHINCNVYETYTCNLPLLEILDSQGYNVMLFQNTINLSYPDGEYSSVSLSDLLSICYRTVIDFSSISEKTKDMFQTVHRITEMLCIFVSCGFLSDIINAGAFTVQYRNNYLYSPQVLDYVLNMNNRRAYVWHTDELESKLTTVANTLYRLLFTDSIINCSELSDDSSTWITVRRENPVSLFAISKIRYIRLMCSHDTDIPIKDIFYNFSLHSLRGTSISLEM